MQDQEIVIRPGDIGFSMYKRSRLSQLMGWFMQSKWSHSWMELGTLYEFPCVIETSDFEVTVSPFFKYYDTRSYRIEVWSPINFTDEEREAVCKKALPLLGEVYGYFQLLSLGLRRILKRLGYRIPNFIKQGIVCCHVPMYAYKGSSIKSLSTLDDESLDTQELYEIVTLSGHFKKVLEL